MTQENKPKADMQLGHYTLTVKLAEGITSETWLAEHCYLESKEVCLKIFSDERFIRVLQQQKFLRVVKAPLHLPHIEDYDPTGQMPYLAQEVVPGKSLRQLLRKKKRLSPDTAFDFMRKILISLKVLHDQNIAHLDLRPEHLLIDSNGHVRLLDYILGQVMTLTVSDYYREFATKNIPLPKPVMRSLLYKSKQHRIGTDLSSRSDIFSLGIILFEMVTGTYPTKKAEIPSQEIPSLPSKVDRIYNACCGKGDEFFSNCDELLDALQQDALPTTSAPNAPAAQQAPVMPGITILRENAAIISVTTLANGKNYVDGKNIGTLSKNLDEIRTSKLCCLAFDFTNIEYVNSSTIGFFVNFNDQIHSKGGAVVFFNVQNQVMTILSALGLEQVLRIVPTEQEAKAYLLSLGN